MLPTNKQPEEEAALPILISDSQLGQRFTRDDHRFEVFQSVLVIDIEQVQGSAHGGDTPPS